MIPVGVWPESLSPPRVLFGLTAALLLLLLVGKLPFMGAVNNAIRAFCDKHNIELYDKITYRYRCASRHSGIVIAVVIRSTTLY